jgi:ornithine--oxo-acid transaminase
MEALQVLKDEQMAENAEVMGAYLRNSLEALQSPYIQLVRGRGLLNAIVINHSNPEAAWDYCLALKDNGLLAKPTHGDKIRFAPPLLINKTQIDECVQIISASFKALD